MVIRDGEMPCKTFPNMDTEPGNADDFGQSVQAPSENNGHRRVPAARRFAYTQQKCAVTGRNTTHDLKPSKAFHRVTQTPGLAEEIVPPWGVCLFGRLVSIRRRSASIVCWRPCCLVAQKS